MASVCLYFQVHQPRRLKKFQAFDIGRNVEYFADYEDGFNVHNPGILRKVAQSCYLPANKILKKLLDQHPEFKMSFSFTGVFLKQLEEHMPHVLESFQELVATGRVEVLGETYYHSLSSVFSEDEFIDQINQHSELMQEVFGVKPQVFRNTELIYNNEIAAVAQKLGFQAILAEGADKVLGWRSPNYVYGTPADLPILLKNYKLSDDIAFRFSHENWSEFPLTAEKYANWISGAHEDEQVVNIFIDYETFGEHHDEATGIFDFLTHLPAHLLSSNKTDFVLPSEAVAKFQPVSRIDVPYHTSWADEERDLSAWLGNDMQRHAAEKIFALRDRVLATENADLINTWRQLQTSDHFYYMCTKWFRDGDIHKYFSPYESPYIAFISYMNVLQDLDLRISEIEHHQELATQAEDQQGMGIDEMVLPDLAAELGQQMATV